MISVFDSCEKCGKELGDCVCMKPEPCVGEITMNNITLKITPTTRPILKRHLIKLIDKRLTEAEEKFKQQSGDSV